MKTFRSSDGLRLAYRDSGSGRAVLCLAGLTRNSRDFDYMVSVLKNVRIIAPDYRGRGESDWDPNLDNYSPIVEARDAVELLDHLGLERVPVIGTSRGGIIAMVIAATNADRLSGVVLNDIGPVIEPAGLERIKRYIGRNPTETRFVDAAKAMAADSPGFSGVPSERWVDEARHRYRQTGDRLEINYDAGLRSAVLAALDKGAPDLWPFFDAMRTLPVTVIRGSNSDLLSVGTVCEMRARHASLAAVEIPGRGHCPFLDEPLCCTAIEEFLALVH
ncbi:MAG: alpha/beta hydrolase [Rhodobacteraceae bacterium]|nr:alpha/beta hydrolase [Paracoccaceae bacterium]